MILNLSTLTYLSCISIFNYLSQLRAIQYCINTNYQMRCINQVLAKQIQNAGEKIM